MLHRNIEFKRLRDENPVLVDAVVEHMTRYGLQCVQGSEGVYIRLLDEARLCFEWNQFETATSLCEASIYVAGCGGGVWHMRFSKECITVIGKAWALHNRRNSRSNRITRGSHGEVVVR